MSRLVRAEMMKLWSTRAVPGALAGMFAVTAGWTVFTLLQAGRHGAPSLGTTGSMRALLTSPAAAAVPLLLLGTVAVTSEFRHRTAAAAFLVEPRRARIVAAKAAAVAVLAAGYAVTALVVVLAVALPWLAAKGVPVDLANRTLLLACLGWMLRLPLYGLLGVASGALLRNPVAAALLPLIWLYLVETYVDQLVPGAFRWLLTGAGAALARAELAGLLPQWAGALLLTAYGLVLNGVAGAFVTRRDLEG